MSTTILNKPASRGTILPVLGAVSVCHLLNDMMQALLPAVYPILRGEFSLSFAQVGLLTPGETSALPQLKEDAQ